MPNKDSQHIVVYEKNAKNRCNFKLSVSKWSELRWDRNFGKIFKIKSKKTIENVIIFKLETKSKMGELRLSNNPKVIIKAKFPDADWPTMLKYAEPYYIEIIDDLINSSAGNDNILKKIIIMFLKELKIFFRRPIQQIYSKKIEASQIIRGKILVSESIKKLTYLSDKWICSYNSLTEDTLYNQIIKYTLTIIKNLVEGEFLPQITYYLHKLRSVSFRKISRSEINGIKYYSQINPRYLKILKYCKFILEGSMDIQKDGNCEFFSILWDTEHIYESFLLNSLKSLLEPYGYRVYKYYGGKIQPDIIIEKDNIIMLIIDAKYKEKPKEKKVELEDHRQIIHYMIELYKRTEGGILSHKKFPKEYRNGILIYPLSETTDLTEDPVEYDDFDINNEVFMGKYFFYYIDLSRIGDKKYLQGWVNILSKQFLNI
jgi:5-methylcytosine-specific restriction endonuclease McrBC regulatory subunit McrC